MRKLFLTSIVLCLLGCTQSRPAEAAVYHVDWDRGDDSSVGSVEAPWKSPWHASTRLHAGDTVVIHARDDGRPYHRPGCQGAVIEANDADTLWVAAEGEEVKLSSTPEFGIAPWEYCDGKGSTTVYVDAPRTRIDGFHIWGSVLFNKDADGSIIENCDLSGGGDYQGFPAVIRTTGSPPNRTPDNWCDGVVVRHNRLHGNVPAMRQGSTNDTLILTYGASNMIVEYNEFFAALNSGIKWKDRSNGMTARYNWFHDMKVGVQGDGQKGVDWIETHDNLFENLGRQAIAVELGAPNAFRVYNNTFINNTVDIGWWHGLGQNLQIFNNVFVHNEKKQFYQFYDERWRESLHTFSDYNVYAGMKGTGWVVNNRSVANSLKGWQKMLESLDTSEHNSSELKLGWDGQKLKGELPTGRGGDWPDVVGARIDLEKVGPQSK